MFLFFKSETVIYSKHVVDCISEMAALIFPTLRTLPYDGHSEQDVEVFLSLLKLGEPLWLPQWTERSKSDARA